jgi:error-prone DNA polymerase
VSGLVLVRQRPGSANGVLFITLEDETGIANVIVWKKLFEQQRRVVLGASMMAVKGRVQVEGEVIHLIAERLTDQTDLLRSLGGRGEPMPLRPCWSDEVGTGIASRQMPQAKEMYDPNLRLGSGIKPQTRDFR